jgi:alanyl-tRNA synthetase
MSRIRMHSAEHLLNQTMVRLYGCGRCFSAHINSKKSKCDYHFQRALTTEELKEIEARVNQVIEADYPVTTEYIDRDEAKMKFNLDRVPEGENKDLFRIVHMGDYDACPCIGEHVSSTKQIGTFRITTAGFENQVLRIRFKLVS